MAEDISTAAGKPGLLNRILDWIERAGNRLPDPAILFFLFLLATWAFSALLSGVEFSAIDPRTGEPIVVRNLLAGRELTGFLAEMVNTFVRFPPLGVVVQRTIADKNG